MRHTLLTTTAALLGLLLLPHAAQAAPAKAGSWSGSMGFQIGVMGEYEVDVDAPDNTFDASPTLGITPVLEYNLGSNFAVGAEWMFLWIKASDSDGDRDKLWIPHLRARISFPVHPQVEVGAMIGVGMGILLPDKGDDDVALPSYRFAFGGTYEINPQVKAFADVGYLGTTFRRDDNVDFGTALLTAGLLAGF